ncbi:MAG: hypothetical protein Q9218_003565 [Villophora microphyllina]
MACRSERSALMAGHTAAYGNQGTPSSEQLHNHDDEDHFRGNYINTSSLCNGKRWSHAQVHHTKDHRVKYHAPLPVPTRPRWAMNPYDQHGDEKVMRSVQRRRCARVGLGTLIFLGVIQLFAFFSGLLIVFVPNGIHRIIDNWGQVGHIGDGLSSWPTDFSRGILPVPVHSHNDYWRKVPLYSAIEAGCISVEADVWLFGKELYVGHSLASLTPNRTLANLYINPLLAILERQNPTTHFHPESTHSYHGVFDTVPEQSLILLIDFKTSGSTLFPHVVSALEPLRARGYLTHLNGTRIVSRPITVIGTGNTPFDLVTSNITNPHMDIFFDAPLDRMWEGPPGSEPPPPPAKGPVVYGSDIEASVPELATSTEDADGDNNKGQGHSGAHSTPDAYTPLNSYYASVSFRKAIGLVFFGKLSKSQLELIRGHISGAHRRGLKVRYWELPFWPIGLRNYIWDVLVKEGVDMLNVDDLKGATERDWNKEKGWWG